MEKAVFKATRKDIVHPKQKHVDTLIQMTLSGVSMEELFMLLQARFSEANWAISFKALIVVHILMHEGNGPVIYDYLMHHPNVLDMSRFRDRHNTKGVSEFEQSKNVRTYAAYLGDKVLAFKAIRIDHVSQKNPDGSQIYMKHPSDIKFLLLEVSTVQKQLHSVLKNRFDSDTLDNETTFSAFRYCLRDMLKLFQVMNQGVMKMLKVYFEMHEEDMRRALDLYKRFVKLTDRADEYLKIARRFEAIFGFTIPSLNHAPLSLSKALEGFLSMSPEERLPTINEMKRNAKKASPPASAVSHQAVTAGGRENTMHSTAQRAKSDYGLRLKPEILAISGDAAPSQQTAAKPSETVRSASTRIMPDRERASSPVSVTVISSGTRAERPATKNDNVAEMDFIDFFSSIDDEVAANQTSQHNNNLNMAAPFGAGAFEPTAVGSGSTVVGAQQMQGQQQQQQQAGMTDFDAMFQALSNPFAASNGNGGFSEPSTAGSNNVQQQPFDGFSGASMNMPFATAASNNGPAMGFSSAGTTTSSQMQNSNVGGGGYASVSANNPFRQSMYPVQSDGMSQQAVMAQANVQQASYNPFAQRQTMYMDTSSAAGTGNFPLAGSMPFGNVSSSSTSSNTIMVSQTTTGGGFGNNNNNIGNAGALTGFPQQQQQQQQMHMRTASSAAMSSNGNFANFDVFK